MERTWDEDDRFMRVGVENCSIVDNVLSWLERDDAEFEKIFGYGVCLATVTYFIARLFAF